MTKQEAFNKVVRHLFRQKKKAVCRSGLDKGMCRYKVGSLRCAIGALIPAHVYHKAMEGTKVDILTLHFPTLAKYLPEDGTFMYELQKIHDEFSPKEWRGLLESLARAHGLKFPRVANG